MYACGSTRILSKTENISCKDLQEKVAADNGFPNTFAGRYACVVKLPDGTTQKFTAILRSQEGEIATLSIAPLLGIELFRVNLYPDSVLFLNKLDKQYYSGSYKYLSEKLGTELSLALIQDVFSAKALKYADSDRYKCDRNSDFYILKNIPSRKLRKALGLGKDEDYSGDLDSLYAAEKPKKLAKVIKKDDDVFVKRYFFNSNFELSRVLIHEVENNRSLEIKYQGQTSFGSVSAAEEIEISVSDPEQNMSISIKPSKIKSTTSVDRSINIPPKYERIEL